MAPSLAAGQSSRKRSSSDKKRARESDARDFAAALRLSVYDALEAIREAERNTVDPVAFLKALPNGYGEDALAEQGMQ